LLARRIRQPREEVGGRGQQREELARESGSEDHSSRTKTLFDGVSRVESGAEDRVHEPRWSLDIDHVPDIVADEFSGSGLHGRRFPIVMKW